jgi:glutamyl-tRNA synthetase
MAAAPDERTPGTVPVWIVDRSEDRSMSVVTRFAPSPTGYLHIGGARTALFNWLYARGRGGRYLLRIEDTDQERSTPEAVQAIIDGLTWLGLEADGPPLMQSSRFGRHREVVAEMVARGSAFRCTMDEAAVTAGREAARAEGRAFRSTCRDEALGPECGPHVVRLRAPDSDLTVEDRVQGPVTVAGKDIDDLVLLRTDATPTYLLAVVVDDHDMGVTQVIRGDDHLTNTFRQVPIYHGMGWTPPLFAHVPLIHGPDGAKLSKRHGALSVMEYRDMGYLPEAMKNYLLRLGWSHGDAEIISEADATRWFDLDAVGRGPSRLDFDKLAAVNAHYLKEADNARLVELVREAAQRANRPVPDVGLRRLHTAMEVLKTRARTIVELFEQAELLWLPRPLALDDKAAKRLSEAGAAERLAGVAAALAASDEWTADILSQVLQTYVKEAGVGFGQVGPLVRAGLTGGRAAPDLGVLMAWLGREETLGRLADAAERAG